MASFSEKFKNNMEKLPAHLAYKIIDYIPEPKNEQIAKTNHLSCDGVNTYCKLKDSFYNDLPEYQKDLASKIWMYGDYQKVENTLDRWYSKDIDQDWDKFIDKYPYGKCVQPYAIKEILENEKKIYIGGIRLTKTRTKRRISKKHNTKKRTSKKRTSKK